MGGFYTLKKLSPEQIKQLNPRSTKQHIVLHMIRPGKHFCEKKPGRTLIKQKQKQNNTHKSCCTAYKVG